MSSKLLTRGGFAFPATSLEFKTGTWRVALNARLLPPAELVDLPVRHFDGADTWKYLDE